MREEYEKKLKNGDFLGALEMIPSIDWKNITPMSEDWKESLKIIDRQKPEINTTQTEMNKTDMIIHALGYNTIKQ